MFDILNHLWTERGSNKEDLKEITRTENKEETAENSQTNNEEGGPGKLNPHGAY